MQIQVYFSEILPVLTLKTGADSKKQTVLFCLEGIIAQTAIILLHISMKQMISRIVFFEKHMIFAQN